MQTYREAISQGLVQAMEADESIYVLGAGVADPKGVFGTTKLAHDRWPDRVIETPLSENMLTGACLGMALEGLRPVLVHARNDFLMLTMDQLVNNIAKWRYMSGGQVRSLPIVIRAIIGRGWGQGPQHSQALHAMFAHVPGVRVIMPVFPHDAKAFLAGALNGDSPCIILESRRLYDQVSDVGDELYRRTEDHHWVSSSGTDCTLVGIGASYMDVCGAYHLLRAIGIAVAVVLPQVIKPLDMSTIFESVAHTGRLVVVDHATPFCGLAAEIIAQCAEHQIVWRSRPVRLTCPDLPCGTASVYEDSYYPGVSQIVMTVCRLVGRPVPQSLPVSITSDGAFRGPF